MQSCGLRRSNVGGVSVRAGSGADSTQAHDGAPPRQLPQRFDESAQCGPIASGRCRENVSGPSARLLATRCRKPPQRRQHRHQGTHAHIHTRTPSNPSLAHTVLRGVRSPFNSRSLRCLLAVLHKNWTLKKRAWKTTICELVSPSLFLSILVLGY